MIGKLLSNRYEIIEEVGSGGMAIVYKAKCHKLNRYVAVKILKEQYREDKEFVNRFIRESQAAASLSNPNIVSVFDVGHDGDIDYIVMELCDGITLKDYIEKNGMMDWRTSLAFAMQICSALIDAHRNGIIHRDIKPHNVIVMPNGNCKVADFGIAATTSNINETKKVDEGIMGSIHYISPEHVKGVTPDERSDIYSLGITMYEMLTGCLPFDGDSAVSIAIKHINEIPVPIKDINISVPLSVVNVVNKALSKNINDRYQSAKEMYDDMDAIMKDPEMAPATDDTPSEQSELTDETKKIPTKVLDGVLENLGEKQETSVDAAAPVEKKKKKGFFADLFTAKNKKDKKAITWAVITSIIMIFAVTTVCLGIFAPSFGLGALFTRGGTEIEMPSLVGKQLEDAEKEYKKEMDFIIEEVFDNDYEEGEIISHEPLAGMPVKTPIKVKVKVSKGSKELKAPNVVGMDSSNAIKTLSSKGLKHKETIVFDEHAANGTVISQNPSAGTDVKSGDTIELTISKGKDEEMVLMPRLVGLSESQAKSEISSANLKIGAIIKKNSDKPEGTVIEQSIPEGSSLSKNTSVNITVSNGKADESPDDANKPSSTETNTKPESTHKDNETQSKDNTTTHTEPEPQTPAKKSYNLSLTLPTGKDSVSVIVKQGGSTVYDKTVNTSAGSINVTLYGTGTENIQVFYDGQLVRTQKVSF